MPETSPGPPGSGAHRPGAEIARRDGKWRPRRGRECGRPRARRSAPIAHPRTAVGPRHFGSRGRPHFNPAWMDATGPARVREKLFRVPLDQSLAGHGAFAPEERGDSRRGPSEFRPLVVAGLRRAPGSGEQEPAPRSNLSSLRRPRLDEEAGGARETRRVRSIFNAPTVHRSGRSALHLALSIGPVALRAGDRRVDAITSRQVTSVARRHSNARIVCPGRATRARTSSSFLQMRLNALKMASVVPVMVTIRSGHEPSEMLMRAPDCNGANTTGDYVAKIRRRRAHSHSIAGPDVMSAN